MRESILTITFTDTDPEETNDPAQEESFGEAYAYVPSEETTPSPCECPCPLEARMKRLEGRHALLEERFHGVMKNHALHDGS